MSTNDHDPRLEEAVAFALGSLDPGQIDDFKEHLKTCKRCQEELRWLAPAVRALPEAVEPQTPPPALKATSLPNGARASTPRWTRSPPTPSRTRSTGSPQDDGE